MEDIMQVINLQPSGERICLDERYTVQIQLSEAVWQNRMYHRHRLKRADGAE